MSAEDICGHSRIVSLSAYFRVVKRKEILILNDLTGIIKEIKMNRIIKVIITNTVEPSYKLP